jgi:LysR family transcriptional regulator, low CO2-responsive transcriptional regulator
MKTLRLLRNLSMRQLRVFLSAAKHGSFSKAATELSLTAPAVSMQMKELESELGMALFARVGRRVELTSAGEYFLVYVKRIAANLRDAESTLSKLKGTEVGTLKIGLVSTAKYFLPQLLKRFKEEHFGLQIKLEVRNRNQMVELLREGEIDLAIMGRTPADMDTRIEAFARHPHAFIASPEHPLASRQGISPTVLNQIELIVREEGSGTRAIMERFLGERGLTPRVTMEMSSNESIKQAVMADLGISFVSLHTVGLEVATGKLTVLDVDETPIHRAWHVVALNKGNPSAAAEAFRYFVLEHGAGILENV